MDRRTMSKSWFFFETRCEDARMADSVRLGRRTNERKSQSRGILRLRAGGTGQGSQSKGGGERGRENV